MRNAAGRAADMPLSTVTTTGSQQRLVQTMLVERDALPPELLDRAVMTAAFLVKYYGTDGDNEAAQSQPVDRPMDTVTTKARFAVVTVTIDATTYIIVDIGLRMLTPRELARAQGFPEDYVLNPVVRKFLRGKWVERPLTISEQISAIGNSVCPPVARALVAANQADLIERGRRRRHDYFDLPLIKVSHRAVGGGEAQLAVSDHLAARWVFEHWAKVPFCPRPHIAVLARHFLLRGLRRTRASSGAPAFLCPLSTRHREVQA
jgi:hypothetical protein